MVAQRSASMRDSACFCAEHPLGLVVLARDRLRDRIKQRDRRVVGRERHRDAGLAQGIHRHDVVVLLRLELARGGLQRLVEIGVGVGCQHEPHAGDAFDVARRDDVDVAHHPAAALERNLLVDLLVKIEHAEPAAAGDRDRADVVLGALQQQFLEPVAAAGRGSELNPAQPV